MGALRDFVADVLEIGGAAVDPLEPDGLEVLAPPPLRAVLGWPEFARLSFGAEAPEGAMPIGLEGDSLERFGALLGDNGRWVERSLSPDTLTPPPNDCEKMLGQAIELPNAIWRFAKVSPTWTRCLFLTFRYSALSDEKRDGLVRLAINCHDGASLGEVANRLRLQLAVELDWLLPEPHVRQYAGSGLKEAELAGRVRPLLDHEVRQDLDPFVRAMRRRLERDRNRIHEYHNDLRLASLKKLAALRDSASDKAEADRKRETLRVTSVEREYEAKLDDLRHNYALRVSVEWVQGLSLYVPVQRLDLLIRRRKGERTISMDWFPSVRTMQLPLCEWGAGLDRVRLVCDEALHLTEATGQGPCSSCGKAFCRACHPQACPKCGAAVQG